MSKMFFIPRRVFIRALIVFFFIPPTVPTFLKNKVVVTGRDGAAQTPIPRYQRGIGEHQGTTHVSAWGSIELSTYGWGGRDMTGQGDKNQIVKSLKHTVAHLSQTIGIRDFRHYRNLGLAADDITRRFQESGYHVDVMTYEVNGREYRNIMAEVPGDHGRKPFIVVGAHYDTCDNPGADDNASGVAGLLELARLLKGAHTDNRIQFVAFVNEEPPFFKTRDMGSFVYASRMKEQKQEIKAAIILESIGFYTQEKNVQRYPPLLGFFYPNKGNFITVLGNFPSRKVLKKVVAGFKKSSGFPIESLIGPSLISGIDFSDNWSFWKNGYPAVMVTDTAFFRNKYYHTPRDLPETLNYENMAEVVSGLSNAVLELANGQRGNMKTGNK